VIEDQIVLFLLVFGPVAIILDILVALYLFRVGQRGQRWAAEVIEDWKNGTLLDNLITKNEGGEVMMDERLVMFVDAFGSRIAQSLKMGFLQNLGAQAKIEKGLAGALAQDVVEEKLPLLELAGDFLGFNTKKYIAEHPQALGQLAQLAGPYIGMLPGSKRNDGHAQGSVPTMT